ncbi:MAG: DUF4235 domain-containing protein [Frankiaceae bacterium]|jgi:hypothetical protein
MAQAASKMGWKVFGGLSAMASGIVARKLLTTVWTKTTGKTPPANPASATTTWPEAIAWAALSGTAYGIARVVAQRKAADTWRKASGSLPPGMEEVS